MLKRCLVVPLFLESLKWISFTYGLGIFQYATFVLGAKVNESTCESSKSGISIPYSPVSPGHKSCSFQIQLCWRFNSPMKVPRVGVSDVEHKPLAVHGEVLYLWDPSQLFQSVGRHTGGGILARLCLCFFYPSKCGLLIFCCGGSIQLSCPPSPPSRGNRCICSYRLLCPLEEISLGFSYTAVSNYLWSCSLWRYLTKNLVGIRMHGT